MIALWIVLGVVGYFAVGGVATRAFETMPCCRDDDPPAAVLGAVWPVTLAIIAILAVGYWTARGPYLLVDRALDRHAERKRLPEARVVSE